MFSYGGSVLRQKSVGTFLEVEVRVVGQCYIQAVFRLVHLLVDLGKNW